MATPCRTLGCGTHSGRTLPEIWTKWPSISLLRLGGLVQSICSFVHAAESGPLAASQADWAAAKSLADEPFKSQFERIRQVVTAALAQAQHQGVWFNYTVARPAKFWDDGKKIGYRYTWEYEELKDMDSTIECRLLQIGLPRLTQ